MKWIFHNQVLDLVSKRTREASLCDFYWHSSGPFFWIKYVTDCEHCALQASNKTFMSSVFDQKLEILDSLSHLLRTSASSENRHF